MTAAREERVTQSAKARSSRIVEKIKRAMTEIEAEVKASDGIYAYNSGRLSMAEVCRRAGVHAITMMGKAHCKTTRPMIASWIAKLSLVKGAANVRKTVTARSNAADEEYKRIACQFQAMYQVEVPKLINEIKQLRTFAENLQSENTRLQETISKGRVVHLSNLAKEKSKP